jgi:hypothetical protein
MKNITGPLSHGHILTINEPVFTLTDFLSFLEVILRTSAKNDYMAFGRK